MIDTTTENAVNIQTMQNDLLRALRKASV